MSSFDSFPMLFSIEKTLAPIGDNSDGIHNIVLSYHSNLQLRMLWKRSNLHLLANEGVLLAFNLASLHWICWSCYTLTTMSTVKE